MHRRQPYRLLSAIILLLVYLSGGMPGYVWHRHEVRITADTSSRKQIEQSLTHTECSICQHITAEAATPGFIFPLKCITASEISFSSPLFSPVHSSLQLPAGRGPPLAA